MGRWTISKNYKVIVYRLLNMSHILNTLYTIIFVTFRTYTYMLCEQIVWGLLCNICWQTLCTDKVDWNLYNRLTNMQLILFKQMILHFVNAFISGYSFNNKSYSNKFYSKYNHMWRIKHLISLDGTSFYLWQPRYVDAYFNERLSRSSYWNLGCDIDNKFNKFLLLCHFEWQKI